VHVDDHSLAQAAFGLVLTKIDTARPAQPDILGTLCDHGAVIIHDLPIHVEDGIGIHHAGVVRRVHEIELHHVTFIQIGFEHGGCVGALFEGKLHRKRLEVVRVAVPQ